MAEYIDETLEEQSTPAETEEAAVATNAKESPWDELRQLCVNRSATYAFISRLFRTEVDPELAEALKGMRFPAATGNSDVDQGYYLIARYVSNMKSTSLTELAVDYVRTFIGNSNDANGAAFPLESVYTSVHRLRMQDARDEVLAIYRAYGFDQNEDWKEGEDHIAVELEFMQALCERCAQAFAEGDEEGAWSLLQLQQGFLQNHLGAWAPMLTIDMHKFARTDLYKGLAWITHGFLKEESDFLAKALADDAGE